MLGFLNVDKPQWTTSHGAVAAARRRLPRKTKVGHAGTLDPFATGVLVLCVGKATRLASYVQRQPKRYVARVTLGTASTTDDPEGELEARPEARPVGLDDVRRALAGFVGAIDQVPPAHSAVHTGGQRAYELARRGERPALRPRRVVVHAIDLLSYRWPLVELDVRCGAGTYLRALARDLGEALGVGAYCSALARTEVGPFTLDAAAEPGALEPERDLVPVAEGLPTLAQARLAAAAAARFCAGQAADVVGSLPAPGTEVLAMDALGATLGIGRVAADGARLEPYRVLVPAP